MVAFKLHLEWDVIFGFLFVVTGFVGLYEVQATGFLNDSQEHHLSPNAVLGVVLRTLGQARIRYSDSAVWHDLNSFGEDFEKGDSIFTSATGYVSVKYHSYQPCQIYPNSLVVLSMASNPKNLMDEPILEAKQGKLKIFLGPESPSRLIVGGKEYEFKSKDRRANSSVEVQLDTSNGQSKTEISASSSVGVKVFDASGTKEGTSSGQDFDIKPNTKYIRDQNQEKVVLQPTEITSKDDSAVKKPDGKSRIENFLKETSNLRAQEKMKDQSQIETEALKALHEKLKKAGFNIKLE